MLLKRFSSASSTIWVIEGLSVEYRFCRQSRCRSDAVVKPHQELEAYVSFSTTTAQGRSDRGYIGIYTPQNQSTLKYFYACVLLSWPVKISPNFCTPQIRFLATPLPLHGVDQLQSGITHPATSEYSYGMHDLSTGVNYSTHVLADRRFNCCKCK